MTPQEIRNQAKVIRQQFDQPFISAADGDRIIDLLLEVLDQTGAESKRLIKMGGLVIDIMQVTYIGDNGFHADDAKLTFKLRDGEILRWTGEDAETARATIRAMVENGWIESIESIRNVTA